MNQTIKLSLLFRLIQKICSWGALNKKKINFIKNIHHYKLSVFILGLLCCTFQSQADLEDERSTEAGSVCTIDCGEKEGFFTKEEEGFFSNLANIFKECKIAESNKDLKDGKLSTRWAFEMTGADLLKEELEKESPPTDDKNLITFSALAADHFDIQNIFSETLPALNSQQLHNMPINKSRPQYAYARHLIKLASQSKKPSFVNSPGWEDTERTYNAMSNLSPPAVLVQAARDNFPAPFEFIKNKFSRNLDSILVGSISSSGLAGEYSQEGREVHILAPGNNTSNASALVTSALAGFEWLSGYHPTAKEAKLLLERTAVPTVHSVFEQPQMNGKGMLNVYKLGMTAKKLKEKCKNDTACFKREIQNPGSYTFTANQNVLNSANLAFPKCSKNSSHGRPRTRKHRGKTTHCENKQAALKTLRQAVLLDASNVPLLKMLSCIYKENGFTENALGIDKTIAAVEKNKDFLKDTNIENLWEMPLTNAHAKLFLLLDREERAAFLNQELSDLNQELSGETDYSKNDANINKKLNQLIWQAGRLGGAEGSKFIKQLTQHPRTYVRESAAKYAVSLEKPQGLMILEQLVKDPEPDVAIEVARSAGIIGRSIEEESRALEILKTLAQHPNREVRRHVVGSTSSIGGPEGLKIIKQLAQDPQPSIRGLVTYTANDFGKEEGFKILEQLSKDSHDRVREDVIRNLDSQIASEQNLQLLRQMVQTEPNQQLKRTGERLIDQLTKQLQIKGERGADFLNQELTALNQEFSDETHYSKNYANINKKITQLVWQAGRLEGAEGLKFIKQLAQHPNREVRKRVVGSVASIGGPEEGLKIIKQLAQDPEPFVRRSVAKHAANDFGEEGFKILEQLSKDLDYSVRESIIHNLDGQIAPEQKLRLLRQMVQTEPNQQLKRTGERLIDQLKEQL